MRLYTADIAARLGIARSTWTTYVSQGKPKFNPAPQPDGHTMESGHARPWWRPETVQAWHERRPGHGGRPRQ